MSYRILISERADLHIKESIRWYELQQNGLGKLFLLSVKDTLKVLITNPLSCAQIYLEIRRILTNKFNHALFYYIDGIKKQVVVIAVLHTSQNPEIWKQISDNRKE